MAFLHFDRVYAPCAVLIVKDGVDPYEDGNAVLIQGDDDMRAVAENLGWSPDGTLEMPPDASWYDFLQSMAGEGLGPMRAGILNEYLPESDD